MMFYAMNPVLAIEDMKEIYNQKAQDYLLVIYRNII